MMRMLAVFLLGLVLVLQYRLWVVDGGMREVRRLRHEVTTQRDENTKLQDRNRTLAAEVQDLKKGRAAVEERARTDLGMVGKDETFFQVVPPAQSSNTKERIKPAQAQAQLAERKP